MCFFLGALSEIFLLFFFLGWFSAGFIGLGHPRNSGRSNFKVTAGYVNGLKVDFLFLVFSGRRYRASAISYRQENGKRETLVKMFVDESK